MHSRGGRGIEIKRWLLRHEKESAGLDTARSVTPLDLPHSQPVRSVRDPAADALLDEFLDSLWLEDGLSRNTLRAIGATCASSVPGCGRAAGAGCWKQSSRPAR